MFISTELEVSSRWALAAELGSNPSLALTGRLVLANLSSPVVPWGQTCLSHGATELPFLSCCPCTHLEEVSQGHSEAGPSLIKPRAAICPLQGMTLKLLIPSFNNV